MEVYVITVEKRSKTYGEDEDVGPVNHSSSAGSLRYPWQ
jgi:hypothetical protein